MTTATYPFDPDVERRWGNKGESLTAALVESALELGVDPSRESTQLQDILDVDSLQTLAGSSGQTTRVQISFEIWGLRYAVTPLTVAAASQPRTEV
ncbi:hypothetical protein ACH9L7_02165 [Haloferax sp. S1W]|uniref:hypothetical protein n=1 Tax=Haloferax sp. S1W TaxID=3377110 RepID=UPI0037CBE136